MKERTLPNLDSLIPKSPEKKINESPLGKDPPVKYSMDKERNGRVVKFEMYSKDDYATLKSEVEYLKDQNTKMKDLLLEKVSPEQIKESFKDWSEDEWEFKVANVLIEKPFDPNQVRRISGYFNVGTYSDGYPGELFIYTGKQGDETHGWVNSWSKAISLLLQYGISPEKIYNTFKSDEFKPNGPTNISTSLMCKSIVDMIMKYMESNFIPTAKGPDNEDNYFNVVDTITDQED